MQCLLERLNVRQKKGTEPVTILDRNWPAVGMASDAENVRKQLENTFPSICSDSRNCSEVEPDPQRAEAPGEPRRK
tara:strand:- start:212 stop:439 length:228 start_codon:yes stop_codon:yes gene_type:complete